MTKLFDIIKLSSTSKSFLGLTVKLVFIALLSATVLSTAAKAEDSSKPTIDRQSIIDRANKINNWNEWVEADKGNIVGQANPIATTWRATKNALSPFHEDTAWKDAANQGRYKNAVSDLMRSNAGKAYGSMLTKTIFLKDNPQYMNVNPASNEYGNAYAKYKLDNENRINDEIRGSFEKLVDARLKNYDKQGISEAASDVLDDVYLKLDDMTKKYEEQQAAGKNNNEAIITATANEAEVVGSANCATTEQLRQKYQAGCWSCLVVEKLVSSFLTAASKAYEVAQRAGLTVLALGAVMWVLVWGLKNMSSFTQLEPGNILNDLLKFAFKILFAYVVIISGLKVVGNYLINPIMGTGAVIAQQFWPQDIKSETEDYNWETHLDTGGLTKEEIKKATEQKAKNVAEFQVGEAKIQKELEKASTMSYEEKAERLEALKKAADEVKLSGVPKFITYPTNGTVTSPFGKRNFSGCKMHAGVDIGAPNGTPIVAAFEGTVIRVGSEVAGNSSIGYGLRVYIKHPGDWQTIYAHMSKQAVKIGDVVRKGDIIGATGNTGKNAAYHLHFEIHTPQGKPVDPVGISDGVVNEVDYYGTRDQCGNPFGIAGEKWRGTVSPNITPIKLSGDYVMGAGSGSILNADYSTLVIPNLGEIKYSGPTDILSKSVMNSILGATNVITNTMAETMILGDAITCYSTQEKGGAWNLGGAWHTLWFNVYVTNFWMWLEGAAIWCCGFMLTLAVAYYLLDICFKLGFAVIAFPIVMGLWPFNMTKGKLMVCLSIIFKASATFAFLAITTSYSMAMISSSLEGDGGAEGLKQLFAALEIGDARNEVDIKFVSERLAVFGSYFILLLFAFIYSFKLISATINQFVNKFFSDQAFGDASPMHHMATAATKYIKDKAMAPAALARDIAIHQTGELGKNAIKGATVGAVNFARGKGSGGTAAGNATKAAGSTVKAAGKVVQATGKVVGAAGKLANAIPVVGNVVGAALNGAAKGIEAAGEGIKKAGDTVKKAGDAVNKLNIRNNKPEEKKEKK